MDISSIAKALVKSLTLLAVSWERATLGAALTATSQPANTSKGWALYLVACGMSARLSITYGLVLSVSFSLRPAMMAKAGPASTSTVTVEVTPVKRRRAASVSALPSGSELPPANT